MANSSVYPLEVQSDFLSKQTKAHPLQAIAELIWNSVDAEASSVRVFADAGDLGGIHTIRVEDDGQGIRHSDAPQLFRSLGGSWKLSARVTPETRRFLHGSEGRGRLKAFALGSFARWETVYKEGDEFLFYTISMRAGSTNVEVTDPVPAKKRRTGTKCIITEIRSSPNSLKSTEALQSLSEVFASYLKIYDTVQILLPGGKLDPAEAIAAAKVVSIDPIDVEGKKYAVEVELIEWKNPTDRLLYFCNDQGFPLSTCKIQLHVPGLNFSAYLKSSYIHALAHDGTLELGELAPGLKAAIDQIKAEVKTFHRERSSHKAKTLVDRWKEARVYPFSDNPKTEIEKVEREVFDVVALQVNDLLPDFATAQPINQKFQLRMLRQAIESNPDGLDVILSEVLSLSEKKRLELAELLKDTSLSAMINASKLVSDRLKTIAGLEKLLYDKDEKKFLLERTQLHRLLVAHSWVFGEEFNLLVDDQSLTEALRQHLKAIGSSEVVDRSVTLVDGGRGILDLMLGQKIPTARGDELDYLVVELKRPLVKIGSDEITQIKKYALAVAEDPRFHALNTRWTFWVISNEMDAMARAESNQKGAPRGRIFEMASPNLSIWIKTWSEVLQENKHRLGLFQQHLELKANQDDGLQYLREKHKELLPPSTVSPGDEQAVNQ